jgi:L-aminopeptidase/D-esterase-like protein
MNDDLQSKTPAAGVLAGVAAGLAAFVERPQAGQIGAGLHYRRRGAGAARTPGGFGTAYTQLCKQLNVANHYPQAA